MTSLAPIPAPLSILAPKNMASYVGEAARTQVLYWLVNFESQQLLGQRDTLFLAAQNPNSYTWESNGAGSWELMFSEPAIKITTDGTFNNLYFTPNPLYSSADSIVRNNDIGNTIDAEVKIVAADSVGVKISIADGVVSENLVILSDRIQLENADIYYPMDTTDGYHRYTISIKETSVKVYVDRILRIDSATPGTSSSKSISFGHINGVGAAESRWQYLSVSAGAKFPVDLTQLEYTLQVDSSESFNSADLIERTLTNGISGLYNTGVSIGYVFQLPPRNINQAYPFYWRVKVSGTHFTSDWSESSTFVLLKNEKEEVFQRVFNRLPDENVYEKDTYSGNLATTLRAQSAEVDSFNNEFNNIVKDLNYVNTRDSKVGSVLGVLLGVSAQGFNDQIEYRNFVRNLFVNYLNGTTKQSINDTVETLLGKAPLLIEKYSKDPDWILTSDGNPQYVIYDPLHPSLGQIIRLYSENGNAYSWELHLYNPCEVPYRRALIEDVVGKLKPAHTLVFIIYYDERGVAILSPYYYGIDNYNEAYYTSKERVLL